MVVKVVKIRRPDHQKSLVLKAFSHYSPSLGFIVGNNKLSPIETFREKSNHTIDDEDKKNGSSWFSCFRFFLLSENIWFLQM